MYEIIRSAASENGPGHWARNRPVAGNVRSSAPMPSPLDVQGWADDLRRVFRDDDEAVRHRSPADWLPPTDVIERADGLEIVMDLAGIGDRLRVAVVDRILVVSGEKSTGPCNAGAAFHVAERTFGKFQRAVPLRIAFDASAITATLFQGELRIVVPRIDDRRGREIVIPIERL
jgi:HSP20 family molecular chaperone IbpA